MPLLPSCSAALDVAEAVRKIARNGGVSTQRIGRKKDHLLLGNDPCHVLCWNGKDAVPEEAGPYEKAEGRSLRRKTYCLDDAHTPVGRLHAEALGLGEPVVETVDERRCDGCDGTSARDRCRRRFGGAIRRQACVLDAKDACSALFLYVGRGALRVVGRCASSGRKVRWQLWKFSSGSWWAERT